jgi:transmembrane sensor
MELTVTKDLVFNHFNRRSSQLQRELLGQWLQEKANEEKYYEWLEEWESKNPQYLVHSDLALQRYMDFVREPPALVYNGALSASLPPLHMSMRLNRWYWIAACTILLISLGLLLRGSLLYQTYETASGETRSFTLADGSTVLLRANSSLRVPRWGFGQKNREVTLIGEADFAVRHTPDSQKFVVRTAKDFEVIVLGTEFTVHTRSRRAKVLLKSGAVHLHYRENQTPKSMLLQPGQLVILDPKNHADLKIRKEADQRPIQQGERFVFDETSLEEVAFMLEENYGLWVDIEGRDLSGRVLMGSFQADNLDQLLQSISELLDIDVVRQGNRVHLSEND